MSEVFKDVGVKECHCAVGHVASSSWMIMIRQSHNNTILQIPRNYTSNNTVSHRGRLESLRTLLLELKCCNTSV